MMQRFAMANLLLLASEINKSTNLRRAGEWIVVERLLDGKRILVSDSETLDPGKIRDAAPQSLPRNNTLIGDLMFQDSVNDAVYGLLLETPNGTLEPSQGTFFSSFGFIQHSGKSEALKLSGSGVINQTTGPVLWNFQAMRIPWVGDVHWGSIHPTFLITNNS